MTYLRESVFPEDLIGSKTYFKGLEKISLELDLFYRIAHRPYLANLSGGCRNSIVDLKSRSNDSGARALPGTDVEH